MREGLARVTLMSALIEIHGYLSLHMQLTKVGKLPLPLTPRRSLKPKPLNSQTLYYSGLNDENRVLGVGIGY